MYKQDNRLYWYSKFCEDIDERIGETNELSTGFLMLIGLAMVGEAGEAANVIKKIVRDGESSELWEALTVELVDVLIYIIKLIELGSLRFDHAWVSKHIELHKRIDEGKLKSYREALRDLKGVSDSDIAG
jgi:NTP pyrophosphatase (non-canonical NTP hydrolase)